MRLKILVTGKNKKVGADICEHLENDRGYRTLKCAPSKSAIFDMILTELPRVVIICMGDETVDTIKAYDVLKNVNDQGSCTIIVVANEEDEKYFVNKSGLGRVFFLSRPVPLYALYEKLAEIEEAMNNYGREQMDSIREYVSECADTGFKRKHILVVDDETEQLVTIKEQLSEFYDVTLVKSGEAAFKFLLRKIPDLILLDYLMPGEDGPSVLRHMRTIEELASIPVVFLTGVTERDAILKVISELRPQGYVVKPAKKSELVAKIIDVLG